MNLFKEKRFTKKDRIKVFKRNGYNKPSLDKTFFKGFK